MKHLSRPFWAALLIGALSLLVFVTFLANALDRNSIRTSEQVFQAVLADRAENLANMTREYAYWDDAHINLVESFNPSWVESMFADYIEGTSGISMVHVVDGADRELISVVHDKVSRADPASQYGEGFGALTKAARRDKTTLPPIPQTALIGDLTSLYIAGAVAITLDSDDAATASDHVMVFAQPLDLAALLHLDQKYGFSDLRISLHEASFFQASTPIRDHSGRLLGHFVWQPELSGLRMLPFLAAAVLVVYMGMLVSARFFLRRADEIIGALEDAKQRSDLAKEILADQVRRDPLTGLGNRRFFEERIAAMKTTETGRRPYSLLTADLDGFKEINDTHGHEAGDQVLRHVAEAMCTAVRNQDLVFRLGGDEFAIILGKIPMERAEEIGRAIIERVKAPLTVNGSAFPIGTSIGIAFSCEPSELLRQADAALYKAKANGKGRVEIYASG